MPQLTRNDIAALVLQNDQPHDDGVSNEERAAFVAKAFSRSIIALEEVYPYEEALLSHDPITIQAAIYLAHLQHQYYALATADGHCTEERGNTRCAAIQLSAMKLAWHLKHLNVKEYPVPAYPFIN